METHRYCCILVWTYTVLLYKEAGRLKSKTRQRLANHEVWNFFKLVEPTLKRPMKHPWPPVWCPPLTLPLLILLLICCNYFLLKKKEINIINWSWIQAKCNKLKLNSSKVCFILFALCLFSYDVRCWLFLRQLQWWVKLWAADQS